MWCVCVCVQAHVCVYVCSMHVQARVWCVYVCVYVHVSPRLTLGLFPVHSSPYIWRQALWLELELPPAARMTSQLTPGILSPFPMCWAYRQASPPHTHTQEHRSSHLASTLPSKHLPRVMFCFVCSSVYAVLYYLTHDFSHETNNLTHHAFFPFKIFRHFP